MSNIAKRDQHAVTGSIFDVAFRGNEQVESIIADADIIILIDISSSMNDQMGGGKSRLDHAKEALEQVQKAHQGKVLVISFNHGAQYCLGGLPERAEGNTALMPALELAQKFDGTDVQFYVISDGEANDQRAAEAKARSFVDPVHTIYIGPDNGRGEEFMRRLATGTAAGRVEPKMLGTRLAGLLGN